MTHCVPCHYYNVAETLKPSFMCESVYCLTTVQSWCMNALRKTHTVDCMSCEIVVILISAEKNVSRHAVLAAHCRDLRGVLTDSPHVKRRMRYPLLRHSCWCCGLGGLDCIAPLYCVSLLYSTAQNMKLCCFRTTMSS